MNTQLNDISSIFDFKINQTQILFGLNLTSKIASRRSSTNLERSCSFLALNVISTLPSRFVLQPNTVLVIYNYVNMDGCLVQIPFQRHNLYVFQTYFSIYCGSIFFKDIFLRFLSPIFPFSLVIFVGLWSFLE